MGLQIKAEFHTPKSSQYKWKKLPSVQKRFREKAGQGKSRYCKIRSLYKFESTLQKNAILWIPSIRTLLRNLGGVHTCRILQFKFHWLYTCAREVAWKGYRRWELCGCPYSTYSFQTTLLKLLQESIFCSVWKVQESEWTAPSTSRITGADRGHAERMEWGKVKQEIYTENSDLQEWDENHDFLAKLQKMLCVSKNAITHTCMYIWPFYVKKVYSNVRD